MNKYIVKNGIQNDKLKERYEAGETTSLKKWSKKSIIHLLKRGHILEVTEVSDDGKTG